MNMNNIIIDVRSQVEFSAGHVPGSVNIPLNEILPRLGEIKNMRQPLVLCCASGNRSGQAQYMLQANGVECKNGGSWIDLLEEE